MLSRRTSLGILHIALNFDKSCTTKTGLEQTASRPFGRTLGSTCPRSVTCVFLHENARFPLLTALPKPHHKLLTVLYDGGGVTTTHVVTEAIKTITKLGQQFSKFPGWFAGVSSTFSLKSERRGFVNDLVRRVYSIQSEG